MRCAILLVAFALLSSASAFSGARIREIVRAARRAQAGPPASGPEVSAECGAALYNVGMCGKTAWGTISPLCCERATAAYSACDVDVQGMASLLLTYVPMTFGNYYASDFGFEVMANCPAPGASNATCTESMLAGQSCVMAALAGTPVESCCETIQNAVFDCMGYTTAYDEFWTGIITGAMLTGCPAFPAPLCTDAAKALQGCSSTALTGSSSYPSCCGTVDMFNMFCLNQEGLASAFPFTPGFNVTQYSGYCDWLEGGGSHSGSDSSSDSGSDSSSSSGWGGMCDSSRRIPDIFRYGGGFVTTNPTWGNGVAYMAGDQPFYYLDHSQFPNAGYGWQNVPASCL